MAIGKQREKKEANMRERKRQGMMSKLVTFLLAIW
jgi:hypothetical protein